MEMSAKPNFSSIARSLLLKKANEDAQKRVKVEVEEEESKAERMSSTHDVVGQCPPSSTVIMNNSIRPQECRSQSQLSAVVTTKPNSVRVIAPPEQKPAVKSASPQELKPVVNEGSSSVFSCNASSSMHDSAVCDGFYSRVRGLTAEMLSQRVREVGRIERPKYGPKGQALMIRVRMFFDELKALLGPTCKGTLFDSPTALTAAACGVSRSTVIRIGSSLEESGSIPKEHKKNARSRREERLAVLRRHGRRWGETIRKYVRSKLKEKGDVRMTTLHQELEMTQPGFDLSKTTLYRLIRALGFSYKLVNGKPYIFERPLDKERSDDLKNHSDSGAEDDGSDGVECDYHELMEEDLVDEPWMLESVEKNKDDEIAPCYVFRPAKSTTSSNGDDEMTGDQISTL